MGYFLAGTAIAPKWNIIGDVATTRADPPRCHHTYLPANLTTLHPTTLTAAGFDPNRPTLWIAEAVLLYLTPRDIDTLLTTISTLSAPGSTLLLDHANHAFHQLDAIQDTNRRRAAALGITPQSTLEKPRTWLTHHPWHARPANLAALAHQTRRPLPTELRIDHGATARLWLIRARHNPRASIRPSC
ncbi:class I SAM-dependent methyltransferase [Nocardia nepalensis]|uniref:class I SAM-dependent methyltransferase n=1 Tax=Nocardia nepalensis TaxID=3375448 RepID=UPI003B67E851